MIRVLIADDSAFMRKVLSDLFKSQSPTCIFILADINSARIDDCARKSTYSVSSSGGGGRRSNFQRINFSKLPAHEIRWLVFFLTTFFARQ